MGKIEITSNICIDESEIQESFIRSSGPGGQNVNKVATMVQLRFDVANSDSIPDEVKHRLVSLSGNQITEEGILIIESQRFRTQKRNRGDAVERLTKLVRRAAEKPKCRRRTKPTIASKEQRLEIKRRRAQAKRERAAVSMEKE